VKLLEKELERPQRYGMWFVNNSIALHPSSENLIVHTVTTVFVDTRLWKKKHPRKHFQNFRQSYVLLTDRIETYQSQPLVWPSDLLYIMLAGCDWWISIWHVDNMQDWRKFWKRFRGCFVFQSRVSTKMVVTYLGCGDFVVWTRSCTNVISGHNLLCQNY